LINWEELPKPWTKEQCRIRYVEHGDNIGIRLLASISGVSKGSVERWARNDVPTWVEQRRQYRDALRTATQSKTIEKTSSKLSDELSDIVTANYKCHKLVRNYALKVLEVKMRQINEIESLPLAEKVAIVTKSHQGYEINYWSQILTRSTAAIAEVTGMKYYIDINAAAGRLEREGYEIINPSGDGGEIEDEI
jgi:hypothetical protein